MHTFGLSRILNESNDDFHTLNLIQLSSVVLDLRIILELSFVFFEFLLFKEFPLFQDLDKIVGV